MSNSLNWAGLELLGGAGGTYNVVDGQRECPTGPATFGKRRVSRNRINPAD